MKTAFYRGLRVLGGGEKSAPADGYLAPAMVRTPWGNASELRAKRLRPGSGIPREEVVRNQLERLYGATVAIVSEKGYEACTVADLVRVSGVSRSDFYEHFPGKRECFLATLEALVEPTVAMIGRAKAAGGAEKAKEIFAALMRLIVTQAPAARVCFVELYAAGPEAEAVIERAFKRFEAVVRRANEEIPEHQGSPPQLVRAVLGGLRKIIHTRLYRGEEVELLDLVDELWEWGLCYAAPPQPLRARRRATIDVKRFEGYTEAERILSAVAKVIAEKGYQAMSTGDVAERASISLSTFYAHFTDKEDAVLGALEMSGAQMKASVVPATRRAVDWKDGVRTVYEAMFAYLAAEPAFARLVAVNVQGAGARALDQRDRVINSLAAMLGPGYEVSPETPKIAAEAIGGAIYALLSDQIRRAGPQSMPEVAPLATYITLVPFLGPEVAAEVANGSGRRR